MSEEVTKQQYIEACMNDAQTNAEAGDTLILEAVFQRENMRFDEAHLSIALAQTYLKRAEIHQRNAELTLYSVINPS